MSTPIWSRAELEAMTDLQLDVLADVLPQLWDAASEEPDEHAVSDVDIDTTTKLVWTIQGERIIEQEDGTDV